ncbi:MAG TPA: amino acid permease C-terminal domain-containing protein, partial [Ginsengibacter sp.]|nr:amino acid permease C-terminal domain-containing protein [Ginsengibacter sp.]
DAPRAFRVPLVPFIPVLGILVCLGMMVFLPFDTWIRLIVWMLIGLDIYIAYGVKKSKMNAGLKHIKDKSIISACGIALAILLVIMAVAHHAMTDEGAKDFAIYYFSLVFAAIHFVYFIYRYFKDKKVPENAG